MKRTPDNDFNGRIYVANNNNKNNNDEVYDNGGDDDDDDSQDYGYFDGTNRFMLANKFWLNKFPWHFH